MLHQVLQLQPCNTLNLLSGHPLFLHVQVLQSLVHPFQTITRTSFSRIKLVILLGLEWIPGLLLENNLVVDLVQM